MNDFACRLAYVDRARREIRNRGFVQGFFTAIAMVGFVCLYLYIGGGAS